MHSRIEHDTEGTPFSQELIEEISEILSFVYKDKCELANKEIQVYGKTYPTELLFAISVLEKGDDNAIPATFIASADIGEKRQDKILDAIVDGAGIFLEQYLTDSHWDGYSANWSEEELKGITIHCQITRENIKLSIMADQLLNQ
ncbi:MAG: hypothetical protein KAG61_11395 [Bacteriovoracaceae bacterium]|nr:hypothetical protein [Bacteriovoracaceae bacterium]